MALSRITQKQVLARVTLNGTDGTSANAGDFIVQDYFDIPNNEWQIGHLDPTIDDSSEKNLAYQPPIQGKYIDRFKFDSFFIKMWPTCNELLSKINYYYTENEQKILYDKLKEKFDNL